MLQNKILGFAAILILAGFGAIKPRSATLLHNGNRLDVTEVLSAATKTLDMKPDVKGEWMCHCHVNDHISAGMMTMYTVE